VPNAHLFTHPRHLLMEIWETLKTMPAESTTICNMASLTGSIHCTSTFKSYSKENLGLHRCGHMASMSPSGEGGWKIMSKVTNLPLSLYLATSVNHRYLWRVCRKLRTSSASCQYFCLYTYKIGETDQQRQWRYLTGHISLPISGL